MKQLLLSISIIAALAGCSSTPKEPIEDRVPVSRTTEAVHVNDPSASFKDEHLVSSFSRKSIKLEWNCKYVGDICTKGALTSIEVTGYAPSHGNTEALHEAAFGVAHDVALDKLVRFVKQDVSSSRVTNTLTKNVEKANESVKHNATDSVDQTDDDTDVKSTGLDRTNTNKIVRDITETIRTQANGIVRGASVLEESVIDSRTVSVTIRWSVDSAEQSTNISRYFR